jgi:hypothetical protein
LTSAPSASLACNENLFPSPQTPLVLVQLRKNPENLQVVTRLKFRILQMYSLYNCTVTLQRLLNRESNNWSSRSSGRWCTLCTRNTVQHSQNSSNFNTVPRKKQQIREVVRRFHCIYQSQVLITPTDSLAKRRSVTLPDPANSCAHVDQEIELERKKCTGCLSLAISRSLTKFGVD